MLLYYSISMATFQTLHKQNAQLSGTQKNCFKTINNWVFATSIFAILVDFAFEFWYNPLTLYRE